MSSLRERVKQLLMENDGVTPGIYLGSGMMRYGGAKVNPWIEAVKQYGSVAEARKYYKKKAVTEPAPIMTEKEYNPKVPKTAEGRAKKLQMLRERERKRNAEYNEMLRKAKEESQASRRFTEKQAKKIIDSVKGVADRHYFTDSELQKFMEFVDFIKAIPVKKSRK
jgi:hypothetical protein